MPNTVRMLWPYPNKDTDPWFATFEDMVIYMDQSGYSHREDRNIIIGGGGFFSWDSGTGTLSWDEVLEFYSTIAGFRLDLPVDSVTLLDGEVFYVDLARFPRTNITLSPLTALTVPNTNDAYVIAIRRGDDVYFRMGEKLQNGETRDLFSGTGAGANTDTYERDATFGVPLGASTEEATLGRINFAGSVVGLSAELTQPLTGGSIVVDAKVNGVTKLTVVLDGSATVSTQVTAVPGTYPTSLNDQISIEYTAAGYLNTLLVDGGLTVNLTLSSGIQLPPGGIALADSSTTGITRLSVDPAVAGVPIAVGDNDPRLVENRRIVHTWVAGDGRDIIVTIPIPMPDSQYIVLHTLATSPNHVTLNVPEADRAAGQFRVLLSGGLTNPTTIYFHVVAL